MRRHRTKQPIGPATPPSSAAPATARQNSSSMPIMSVMVVVMPRNVENPARRAVRMIVAMAVKRDLIGHLRAEQGDEGGIAHHGSRIALAANMPVETDHMIGRSHDDVKVG